MVEPTASLSDQEVPHLFDVITLLRNQGVGIIYIRIALTKSRSSRIASLSEMMAKRPPPETLERLRKAN